MIALIYFVLAILASPFKSKSRLEAENAALRRQLLVLQRKVGRAKLTNNDRCFFVQLYRWFPSILEVLAHPSRDLAAMAQGGLSLLLALEITTRRATTGSGRTARAHPTNEHREPAVGRASYPWRTPQARV